MTTDAPNRRSTHFGFTSPWDALGLAPGIARLIGEEAERWEEEAQEIGPSMRALWTLVRGDRGELERLAFAALASRWCSPAEAGMLLAATADRAEDLVSTLQVMRARRLGYVPSTPTAAGADEPGLGASIAQWPLQAAFPREPVPAEWIAWEELAMDGCLGGAAFRILRYGLAMTFAEEHHAAPPEVS